MANASGLYLSVQALEELKELSDELQDHRLEGIIIGLDCFLKSCEPDVDHAESFLAGMRWSVTKLFEELGVIQHPRCVNVVAMFSPGIVMAG